MTEPRTLHRKLAQIMYEAERIPKNGTAPREMGGYKFVQVGDAADYIRKELAAKGLTMMPTSIDIIGQTDRPTKSGGSMTTLDLRVEWTITDGDSGESITIVSFGAGADGGDKYSGKATTSAMKYALLSGFLLSTGEDSELGTETAGRTAEMAPRHADKPDPGLAATRADQPELVGSWTGTGAFGVNKKPPADGFMRQEPEGAIVICTFATVDNKKIPQAVVRGSMAADFIDAAGSQLDGLVATIDGDLYRVPWFKDGREMPAYQRLEVKRIQTSSWSLPVPEPPTEPMFDESELDALPV